MPLAKDPDGGGTEADGSRSRTYCSLCYRDGAFVHPGVSVEEFLQVEYPELCVGMLYFGCLRDCEAVVTEGVRKFISHYDYIKIRMLRLRAAQRVAQNRGA